MWRAMLGGLSALFLAGQTQAGEIHSSDLCPGGAGVPIADTVCQAIDFDGLNRTFNLYAPGPDAPRPLALVFVLHGNRMTGIDMVRITGDTFHRMAERDGAIIVYPDAVDLSWNNGRHNPRSRAYSEGIDDVGFISRLIDGIAGEHPVELAHVYVTGVSNGGMMTFRLGCALSPQLAAIAPVIANMPFDIMPDCEPSRPVSVLVMNGTEDPFMPFEGSRLISPSRRQGLVASTDDSLAFWARHNGCNPQAEVTLLPDRAPDDGTRVERVVWSHCGVGVSVILDKIVGGGHMLPGYQGPMPVSVAGRISREIDGVEEIWAFFMSHRRTN